MTAATESNSLETKNNVNENNVYKLKYVTLLKECKAIEMENCKNAEQIYQMNKIIHKVSKQKR